MIPILLSLRVQWFRIWIPLFIVWLLLLPLVLLLLPVALVACLMVRINAFRAFAVFWQLFSSFSGTRIDLDEGKYAVAIRIY